MTPTPSRDEMLALDETGLEAAVRECARITAPEISDEDYARLKDANSWQYRNTRKEIARAIRAYLAVSASDGVQGSIPDGQQCNEQSAQGLSPATGGDA